MKATYILLICIYLLNPSAYSSDLLDKTWLRIPKDGESRPSWWFDVWYSNCIILYCEFEEKAELNNPKKITVEEVDGDVTSIKNIRLHNKLFKIINVLKVTDSQNYLTSGSFEKEAVIKPYAASYLKPGRESWVGPIKFTNGKRYVICLTDMGIVDPGKYLIEWSLDGNYMEVIKSIIKSQKELEKEKLLNYNRESSD
jgi:hypothetical protein